MAVVFSLCLTASVAHGTTWNFDITTTGNDVSWSSPTAVDPSAAGYTASYEITLVEVDVKWMGIPFNNIDVTGMIDPSLLSQTGYADGPAPIVVFDDSFLWPPPPQPPGVAADIVMGLDAFGYGYTNATNVYLGTVEIDLGPPIGIQTVSIESLRIVGHLTVYTTWYDLGNALAGTHGIPTLTGTGYLTGGEPMGISLTGALENSTAFLAIGFSRIDAPLYGGTLVPAPNIVVVLPTGASGSINLSTTWPDGVPAGFSTYFQYWIQDPAGPHGFAASNGLEGIAN